MKATADKIKQEEVIQLNPVFAESMRTLRGVQLKVREFYDQNPEYKDCIYEFFGKFDNCLSEAALLLSEIARTQLLDNFYKTPKQ